MLYNQFNNYPPFYGSHYKSVPYQMHETRQFQPNYFQPISSYQQNIHPFPFESYPNPYSALQQGGMNSLYMKENPAELLFKNPLDEQENQNPFMNKWGNSAQQSPYHLMYPKQMFFHRPPSNMQMFLNSFKKQDGSYDFNKMIDTAGLMINAVNQVSSVLKGLGGIFKV